MRIVREAIPQILPAMVEALSVVGWRERMPTRQGIDNPLRGFTTLLRHYRDVTADNLRLI
jgi:hypothetical protein